MKGLIIFINRFKVCNNEVWRRMKTQAVINNIGLIKLDCIREVRIWY